MLLQVCIAEVSLVADLAGVCSDVIMPSHMVLSIATGYESFRTHFARILLDVQVLFDMLRQV